MGLLKYLKHFALLAAAGMAFLPAAFAQAGEAELPPGPGRELVAKICSGCHDFGTFTQNRFTKEKWRSTVDKMVARGAEGSDEELEQVVNYLAAHFGPDAPSEKLNANRATAAELAKTLAITESDATAIVAYRTKHGNFKNLAELESVPGIDRKKIESKKDSIEF